MARKAKSKCADQSAYAQADLHLCCSHTTVSFSCFETQLKIKKFAFKVIGLFHSYWVFTLLCYCFI